MVAVDAQRSQWRLNMKRAFYWRLGLSVALVVAVSSCGSQGEEEGFDVGLTQSALSLTGHWVYDAGTQCTVNGVTMHCCPSGYAMIGAHIDKNVFKCAQLTAMAGSRYLDAGTQRNGMHACPWGSVMVGLHAGRNMLACQRPSTSPYFEYVDGNPATQDGYPMHAWPNGYAMAGIHDGKNLFSCDY